MTTFLPRRWQPTDDYDDDARWRDDADGGDRWRAYGACRADGVDPDLFFPVDVTIDGDVVSEEEPAYPPPEVMAICNRCRVRAKCLTRYVNEPYGIFGGTTGYQRALMNKKIKRKGCPGCGSTDVVQSTSQRQEACLACGISWDVL